MRAFVDLYLQLDASNRSGTKTAALTGYFATAAPADAAWALWLLSGQRIPQPVPTRVLKAAAMEHCRVDEALFGSCYETVGDLAETIALLLPDTADADQRGLAEWVTTTLLPLRRQATAQQVAALKQIWSCLDRDAAFVVNKLLTGGFRVGVSRALALRGLSAACGIPTEVLAARLAGAWRPSAEAWATLVSAAPQRAEGGQPYPFRLAHPLEADPTTLGDAARWLLDWKWDGIRGQLVRRESAHLWSRGDEALDAAFPELRAAALALPPGTVLDGEILVAEGDGVAPFSALQQRLGRRAPGRALLHSHPAIFLAFDLLEQAGEDWRARPLWQRREQLALVLAGLPAGSPLRLTPPVLAIGTGAADWNIAAALRQQARQHRAEGLMLKHRDSAYGVGRSRGDWWKWKLDPYSVDAVLIYAQAGHGRRAGLFSDYTFGVWRGDELVPFAKAYSGLSDAELREVDRFVRRHTLDTFGPVRRVQAELVFEVGFEGIVTSRRHRAGLAVRFPRMLRWRRDKTAAQADTLEALQTLLGSTETQPAKDSLAPR